jgi:hypothetical protein
MKGAVQRFLLLVFKVRIDKHLLAPTGRSRRRPPHRAASVSLEEAPFRTISSFPGYSNLSITQFYLQKLENRQISSWLKVAALLEL